MVSKVFPSPKLSGGQSSKNFMLKEIGCGVFLADFANHGLADFGIFGNLLTLVATHTVSINRRQYYGGMAKFRLSA